MFLKSREAFCAISRLDLFIAPFPGKFSADTLDSELSLLLLYSVNLPIILGKGTDNEASAVWPRGLKRHFFGDREITIA